MSAPPPTASSPRQKLELRAEPVESLSDSELHHLSRAFFYRLERNALDVPIAPEEREELAEIAARDWTAVSNWHDDGVLHSATVEFARWAKVRVVAGTDNYRKVHNAVRLAHIEHYRREYERMAGRRIAATPEPRFRDIEQHRPPMSQLTLAQAVKRYTEDPSRADAAPKTRAAWNFRFGAWMDLLGEDKLVVKINREDVRAGLEVLMNLPANAVRKYRGVSLREIAGSDEPRNERMLGPKSIKLYIEAPSSLFRYLIDEQIITENPARNVKGPKPSREKARRPWSTEELDRFFHTGPFDQPWSKGRERSRMFWMPLIALFSGAREGELAALSREDVFEQDGVWLIRLVDSEVRRLKNAQSERAFPVHPKLIELGFPEFVRSQPAGGLLFADIRETKLGPVHWTQKMIGRHVRKVFSDPKIVFHSLRHNFRDAAREAGIPDEVVGQIGGWIEGRRSAMASYGLGYNSKTLAMWMAKVGYSGVSLEHLVPIAAAGGPLRTRIRQRPGSVS